MNILIKAILKLCTTYQLSFFLIFDCWLLVSQPPKLGAITEYCSDEIPRGFVEFKKRKCRRNAWLPDRPGATGGEGIPWPCPPKWLLVPPKQKLCPPSEECALKKLTSSRLLECKSRPKTPDLVFTASDIREQELFFCNYCGLTLDFIKRLWRRPFFFLFFLVFT